MSHKLQRNLKKIEKIKMKIRKHRISIAILSIFHKKQKKFFFQLDFFSGYRMPATEGTPDEIYRLMLRCWEYEPEKRPHFEQIYSIVETLSQAYM